MDSMFTSCVIDDFMLDEVFNAFMMFIMCFVVPLKRCLGETLECPFTESMLATHAHFPQVPRLAEAPAEY
jgi:hypothetical protein